MNFGKQATTMSVPDMRKMLGLGKTESYWLVKQKHFETVIRAGQMRVVIASFDEWYENQTHYHKINGPEPGKKIRSESLTIREAADLLGIHKETFREMVVLKQDFHLIQTKQGFRILRDEFEAWYAGQTHYRKAEGRVKDLPLEMASMSIPEMGRMICIDRRESYKVAYRYRDQLDFVTVADQKRVTKESFERWYQGQTEYKKFEDLPEEQQEEVVLKNDQAVLKNRLPNGKNMYTVQELAKVMMIDEHIIYQRIESNELHAKKIAQKWRITLPDIIAWIENETTITE